MARSPQLLVLVAMLAFACSSPSSVTPEWLTAPTPATHEKYFPIATGPHAVDCNKCHGGFDTFSKFDCLECHKAPDTNPKHEGLAGYAYESASCYRCHPKGTADSIAPAEHARYFPIDDAGKHAHLACAKCHVDASDRKVVDCTGCHAQGDMTPKHATVGGFTWQALAKDTSALCLRCHADSQVDRIVAHAPFGITASTKHFQASCLLCHPNARTDKPFGEDFRQQDCTTCHAQAKDRIETRHTGISGFASDTASCLRCHPNGGPSGNLDHSPFFPIDAASKHASVSCAQCHTDPANRKVVDCTTCHAQADMTPKHASVGGFAWQATGTDTSSLCLKCHADSQVDRVAAHAPFGITSGTKHFQSSCLLCHPNARVDKPFGEDFKKQDCTTCHAEAKDRIATRHTGIPGFSSDSASCLTCHPNGAANATMDHSPFFPIDAASKHAGVSCAQCHTDPANRKVVDCTTCHAQADMTPKHAAVGGFAWQATGTDTSALCLKCHADSQLDRVAAHAPFGITAATKHFQASCLLCHPNARVDKPFGENFQQQDCTTCHAEAKDRIATRHTGIPGFSSDSASCLTCHPNGAANATMDHSPFFPIDAASKHSGVSCAQCHTNSTNRKLVDCTACHTQSLMTPKHGSVGGFAWKATPADTSALCLKCHADSQIDRVAAHAPFGITSSTKHFQASCLLCHPNARVDKPFGEDFRQQDCTTCHAEAKDQIASRHTGIPGFSGDTASCLTCHPSGGANATMDHSPYFPIDAASKHAGVSCAQCHTDPTNRKVVDCTACHTQALVTPTHASVGGFAWKATGADTSALCLRCHADSQVDRVAAHAPFGINSGTQHFQASCLLCHPNARTDKPFGENFRQQDCTTCHAEAKDQIATRHTGISGFAPDTGSCLLCHPNGGPAGNFDHSAKFPIDSLSKHTGISCSQCHVDPANRQLVDCTTCHAQATMTPLHASVGGFAWKTTATDTSALCLKCHADSQVNRIAAHAPFGLGATTKHFQASCLLCHPNARVDKPFGENFQQEDCTTCHAEAKDQVASRHSGITGFLADTASCLRCHPNGGAAPFAHAPFFPIDAGTKHAGITCAQCHPTPTNRKVVDCTACHTQTLMGPKHTLVGGYAWQTTTAATSALCLRCHADSQVDRVAAHLPFHIVSYPNLDVKHIRSSCLVCHPVMRSDKPFGEDFTKKDCSGCHAKAHMDDTHQGMPTYRYDTTVCLTCHANGSKP